MSLTCLSVSPNIKKPLLRLCETRACLHVVLLRFELRLADPESDVLPLHHRTVRPALVVSLGFEPKQTEPKSVVLPLHHETITLTKLLPFESGAKVRCFFHSPKFSGKNRAVRPGHRAHIGGGTTCRVFWRAHIAVPIQVYRDLSNHRPHKAADTFFKSRHKVAGQAMCASYRTWNERNGYVRYAAIAFLAYSAISRK